MASSSGILAMFARSPIRPLQMHMEKATEAANLLKPFFEAVINEDWQKATSIRQEITDYEHQADALKMDFRQHLPKSLFLPVPRMDLLELLGRQEMIANVAKDISGIVVGRKMKIPSELCERFVFYLDCSIRAINQANTAISELDELMESGFRGKEVKHVDAMILELNKIETESDQLQIKIRESLFAIEKQLAPVDVIFLYKIIDWIGLLADSANQTGSRLKMLFAD